MSESEKKKALEKVKFVYTKPENYEPIYVNGAYGGMTPRGDLLCHFFYEYKDVPAEEVMPLVEGRAQYDKVTKVNRIEHAPKELVIKRDVRVGLIIPAHQISMIANWMIDKLKASHITVVKEEG